MRPASHYTPKPDLALLIDDQISNDKIAAFLKKNKPGTQLCLFTTLNKQLYLAADTLENREVTLYSSRRLIKSTLDHLKSDVAVKTVLSDIRAAIQRDPKDSQVMQIGRDQLAHILAGSTTAITHRDRQPEKTSSQIAAEPELELLRPQIKSTLKEQAVDGDERSVRSLGAKWAAATINRFREDINKLSRQALDQFKLAMQARPDADLANAFIQYCDKHLEHKLSDTELKQLAQCVVSSYKKEMSTAEYDANTDTVIIGKQVFTPVGARHKGGFGEVQVYTDGKHRASTLAAKFAIPAKNRSIIDDANAELHNHLLAMGGGHDNVMAIRGAIRTDKEVILLMEDCSPGTLESFGEKLAAAERAGTLDSEAAGQIRLSLARDFLRGLAYLHERSGMTHGDLKPQNIFIGVDGQAKVGDFDRTEAGNAYRMPKSKLPATNQYLAPEVIADIVVTDAAYQNFTAQTPPPDIKQKSAFRKLQNVTLSQNADTFAAGVALYELFYGVNPFNRHLEDIEGPVTFSDYQELMDRFTRVTPEGRRSFLFADVTLLPGLAKHEDELRKLIFSLMAPSPGYRATPTAALKRPVFSLPDLDKPEIRDQIRTL